MTTTPSKIATRYFYTAARAHHAKCMAVDFGMLFFTPEDDEYAEEVYRADNIDQAFEFHEVEKLFVHPDSLHLLEPRLGDTVTDPTGQPFLINMISDDGYVLNGSSFSTHISQCKIIQRNGLAFMWPEQEEV